MTKFQIPNKLIEPSPTAPLPEGEGSKVKNHRLASNRVRVIGYWSLVIIWLLVIGYWSFAFASLQRIISAMPSNTEILYALGLADKVVGVKDFCNYPPEAKKKEKIGGVILNTEKIISLKPDLIVMLEDAQPREIEKLKKLKLPILTVNPHNLDEVMDSIIKIGKATGKEEKAIQLTQKMKRKIKNLARYPTRPKVFVEIWHEPLMAAGKGTFIDDLINKVGAYNVASEAKGSYPQFSFERLVQLNPDIIIIPKENVRDPKMIYNDPKWRNLRAVKERKILFIESDLISRPGPRLVEALEKIAEFIY